MSCLPVGLTFTLFPWGDYDTSQTVLQVCGQEVASSIIQAVNPSRYRNLAGQLEISQNSHAAHCQGALLTRSS